MDRIDEAVEVALDAWRTTNCTFGDTDALMRAALLAGVKVLLGEPVAWQYRCTDPHDGVSMWSNIDERHVHLVQGKPSIEVRVLYAPSLGEGDGR